MSRVHFLPTLSIFGLCIGVSFAQNELLSDAQSTPEQTITKYGYPYENHTVETSDGYLLELHRISNSGKAPVFIMHGFLSSSADFLVLGPKKSIPFLLAEAGYDVWLGNSRGNTYGRRHVSINPDKENAKFYNFTLQELATLDLPATIDYILNTTGHNSLNYIGHSQGTTIGTILLAELPEYNEKIKKLSLLAPVVYLRHAQSIAFKFLDIAYDLLVVYLKISDHYEILSRNSISTQLLRVVCSSLIFREVCADGMFLLLGFDPEEFNTDLFPKILANYPAGASLKQGVHFEQIRKNDKFAKYDYGTKGNLQMYGSTKPPIYDLSRITAPIVLHYSTNDYMAAVEDVLRLAGELSSENLKLVPWPKFNHADHLFAKDVVPLLYNRVIREIEAST